MLDAPAPRCVICPRQLLDHEAGRFICAPCEHRIDQDLRKLAGPAGLYARLCLRIQPGRGGDGPVVTRSAGHPMPCNETVLSLVANGGIVSTLETWVEDWASYGLGVHGPGGRIQHRVDQAVATLRRNLTRAAYRHPALDECADEIRRIVRQAEAIISGEKQPRRVAVQCLCGTVSKVTLDTDGFECRNCEREYGHSEALRLPLAERRAA
jgi:ribosomal protein S10